MAAAPGTETTQMRRRETYCSCEVKALPTGGDGQNCHLSKTSSGSNSRNDIRRSILPVTPANTRKEKEGGRETERYRESNRKSQIYQLKGNTQTDREERNR